MNAQFVTYTAGRALVDEITNKDTGNTYGRATGVDREVMYSNVKGRWEIYAYAGGGHRLFATASSAQAIAFAIDYVS